MGSLTDDFIKHPVFQKTQDMLNAVSESGFAFDINDDVRAVLDRLRVCGRFVETRINQADPLLAPTLTLNNMAAQITTICNEVNAFKGNKNQAHIMNCQKTIDALIQNVMMIPIAEGQEVVKSNKVAAEEYWKLMADAVKTVKESQKEVQEKFDAANQKMGELNKGIESQKVRLDAITSQFQNQFSEAQESRIGKFSEFLKVKGEEVAVGEKARSEAFNLLFSGVHKDVADLKNVAGLELKALITNLMNDGANALSILNNHKIEVERLVGVITNTGWVGGFQKIANEERESAGKWEMGAIWSMIGLTVFAAITLFLTFKNGFNWGSFAARVFVTLTFGVLAGYCALQAEQRRKNERRNRRLELELASMNPFLASLPEASQNDIKKGLAEKYFGQNDPVTEKGEKITPTNLFDLLKIVITNLTKK